MSGNSADSDRVLGVVVLARHGDREGFYQDPKTYTPSDTRITPLGNQQAYQLGTLLRSIYFDSSSPDYIRDIDEAPLANLDQIRVRADAGGEAGVVYGSAAAMLQGLFPPTDQYNTTLANGTTVVGPLGGYQTVPIESVEPENDISLEGFVECKAFTASIEALTRSSVFAQKVQENAEFFQELLPYLDGRQASMQDMWNVFDYMNVQSIHNASYSARLPESHLARARDLANWLQYHIFSSPQLDGIGNIAGRTVLPSILNGFAQITDSKNELKFFYEAVSYKPFISLFNMTGAAEMNPELAGIVDFSAAIAFEVRAAEGAEPFLRLKFKNGTNDSTFETYSFLGSANDVPLSTFVQRLSPAAVNDTDTWCTVCQNTNERGCAALGQARAEGMAVAMSNQGPISPIGAGFLGAGLALASILSLFFALVLLGFIQLGRQPRRKNRVDLSDAQSQGSDIKV